ncbi:tRNA A64-2'-O-ribosylphosphate transferase isoform X2 [Euphorbia lathyris]|uniref:tRNA A64-2'-O-ribosylphosphate transferase isoform X2 n=1 Tax=Euphorbia lathyris TaxID=212925 RepID=UPI0033138F88
MPLVTSNPPTATLIIGPLTPLASTSMSPSLLKRGCFIIDSTRKGKRFPDSMSKTIPIWACVLNRSILNYKKKLRDNEMTMHKEADASSCAQYTSLDSDNWDCSLHLPLWVPDTEKSAIEDRLEQWAKELEDSGADIASIALSLEKPLRPLWISQKTVIWLNEVPDHDSWDFTPIILVSASSPSGIYQHRTTSEFSWNYIPGAGDDEESWARGLSPSLFWNNVYDLIGSEPGLCNQKVADIVEKDRVYRSHRGQNAPQVTLKSPKMIDRGIDPSQIDYSLSLDVDNSNSSLSSSEIDEKLYWLGSTNLAVGSTQLAIDVSNADCVLNCDQQSINVSLEESEAYLHLPMMSSKLDRFSILNNLPAAVRFAKANLRKGNRLLVCCQNGEDISVCVCLAILTSLFNDEGTFDDGKPFSNTDITKWEMRRRLVFICKFAVNARPSRGNLKQVFAFLSEQRSPPSTSPCSGDK